MNKTCLVCGRKISKKLGRYQIHPGTCKVLREREINHKSYINNLETKRAASRKRGRVLSAMRHEREDKIKKMTPEELIRFVESEDI